MGRRGIVRCGTHLRIFHRRPDAYPVPSTGVPDMCVLLPSCIELTPTAPPAPATPTRCALDVESSEARDVVRSPLVCTRQPWSVARRGSGARTTCVRGLYDTGDPPYSWSAGGIVDVSNTPSFSSGKMPSIGARCVSRVLRARPRLDSPCLPSRTSPSSRRAPHSLVVPPTSRRVHREKSACTVLQKMVRTLDVTTCRQRTHLASRAFKRL